MFLMVTLTSVLCALLVRTSGVWPLVIGVGTLLVATHVFGNLIGTRLRDTSAEVRHWRALQLGLDEDRPVATTNPAEIVRFELPATTPLASSDRIGRWIPLVVLGGVLLGATAGGAVIWLAIGSRITWAGLLVGTVSCGVLGGWFAFLASSFGLIANHAWRHAHHSESRHGKPH